MKGRSGGAGLRIAGIVLLLVAAWQSPRAIPFNMDEFVHYHALGCATSSLGADLPLYRDNCGLYDLRLPGTRTALPLRSYYYIGSFPAIPFYPFWRWIGEPVAVRVQGALFLALVVLLATRVLRLGIATVLTATLVFPLFAFTILIDEGPVGLSALLLLLALGCGRRAIEETGARGMAWAALAGLLLFLGVWVKLVFVWWLPAAGFFFVTELRRRRQAPAPLPPRIVPAVVTGGLALALPTLALLCSVATDGQRYGAALRHGRVSADPELVGAGARRLVQYFTDGALVAPRNVLLPSWPIDAAPVLLALGLLATGLSRPSNRRWEGIGWAAVAVLTFGLVSLSGFSQWPHHSFFPLLPLVFALALVLDASGRRVRLVAGVVALAFWATLFVRWPAASFPAEAAPEKDELLRFVRTRGLDRDTLQVHTTWGTYYIALLFGDPARAVLYLRALPDDPGRIREVRELARARGRPVLLTSGRRWERLQTPAVDAILGPPSRVWRFGAWSAVEYVGAGVPAR